jgi:hypothetical protein
MGMQNIRNEELCKCHIEMPYCWCCELLQHVLSPHRSHVAQKHVLCAQNTVSNIPSLHNEKTVTTYIMKKIVTTYIKYHIWL